VAVERFFSWTPDAVKRLCQRLDNHALALSLAAANIGRRQLSEAALASV